MEAKSILFGVDLAAFGLALVKLLVDRTNLSKTWADLIRALFAAAGVLAVGLHGMGYITSIVEPWVVLVANVVTIFFVSLGYMPGAIGLGTALSDQAKQKAYMGALKLVVSPDEARKSSDRAQTQAYHLAERYRLLGLFDKKL